MFEIVQAVLALIDNVIPLITKGVATVGAVDKVIQVLDVIVPAAIQEAKDLIPTIKNYIATLRSSGILTSDQMDALDAIEAKIDADFDAAIAKAEADDATGG